MPLSDLQSARQSPTTHRFMPGLGYVAMGKPLARPARGMIAKNCMPPPATADNTRHWILPPNGAAERIMIWHAAERAWWPLAPLGGNRAAWTADYLGAHGWEYARPA